MKKKKTNLLTVKPIKYGKVKSNLTLEMHMKWGSNYFVLICGRNKAFIV